MKRYKYYIAVFILLLALVLVKIFLLSPEKSKTPDKAKMANAPVNVGVYIAQNETVNNSIYLTGSIKGNEQVMLQPEVQGKVIAIYFNEGQRVSKGQLLVKLNDADLQAQLKKTRAQIKIAQDKEGRLKKLLEMNAVSQEEYDAALNQVQGLEADVESLQARVQETEIHAPFTGTIGLRNISVGGIVSPSTNIATLVQLDPVKLDFSVPEKYLGLIRKGDKVVFSIEGNDKRFEGRVYALDPSLDEQTRSIQLRAICDNHSGELAPGSFARIEIKPGEKPVGLMVPTQALVPDLQGQKLFVVVGGKSEVRPVSTGIRTADKIEITKGIVAGDSVISSGLLQVKPGVPVRVIKSVAP